MKKYPTTLEEEMTKFLPIAVIGARLIAERQQNVVCADAVSNDAPSEQVNALFAKRGEVLDDLDRKIWDINTPK